MPAFAARVAWSIDLFSRASRSLSPIVDFMRPPGHVCHFLLDKTTFMSYLAARVYAIKIILSSSYAGMHMEKGQVNYLIGIGGWEHEVLDDRFYPHPGLSSTEKLSYYAGFFETVEIRPTFWDETLRAEDARPWIDAVAHARTFRFNIKLHASFTHKRTVKR